MNPRTSVVALTLKDKSNGYTAFQSLILSSNDNMAPVDEALDSLANDEEIYAVVAAPSGEKYIWQHDRLYANCNAFHVAADNGFYGVFFKLLERFPEKQRIALMLMINARGETPLNTIVGNFHTYHGKALERAFPLVGGYENREKLESINLTLLLKIITSFQPENRSNVIGHVLSHRSGYLPQSSQNVALINQLLDAIPINDRLAVVSRKSTNIVSFPETMPYCLAFALWKNWIGLEETTRQDYKTLLLKVLDLYQPDERHMAVKDCLSFRWYCLDESERNFWCGYLGIQPTEETKENDSPSFIFTGNYSSPNACERKSVMRC